MTKKMFIRSAHLGVRIMPSVEENKATLYSGFLQCCLLHEWICQKLQTFVVEQWESVDDATWNKTNETSYLGVVWHGDVKHSDPDEMSACRGEIDFSYDNRTQNCNITRTIITDEKAKLSMWEFVDLTE